MHAAREVANPPQASGRERLWRAEVQVVGLALAHRWVGLAVDMHDASRQALAEARRLFRDRNLCVRKVEEFRA